jgi:hypothetical protein
VEMPHLWVEMKMIRWIFGIALALCLSAPNEAFSQATVRPCVTTGANQCPPVSAANPLPISGSFSASGFATNGNFGNLTSTASSSASTVLPAGTVVYLTNTGTTAVSCTPATGVATGLINNIVITSGGGKYPLTVGTYDHIACINQAGDSASNIVVLEGGSGQGNTTGGGGGGGSGGAVTNAGTFAVQLTGATNNVNNIAGTVSLPTGAATAANQTTQNASLATIATNTGAAIPAGTNTIGNVINVPSSTSGNALTGVTCGSAVSSCVLKASAGNFYGVYAECTSACWLMVFNSASAPSNGATTAGVAASNMVECVDIAANSARSITYPVLPTNYSTGITAVISSTACATLTLSTVGFVRGTVL